MSLQSKIAASHTKLKRKLRNYAVDQTGDDIKVIRLTMTTNKYGDDTAMTVVSHGVITLTLDIPDQIPLTRLRTDLGSELTVTTENTYLYDILPIVGFSKFTDQIEKDDFIIQKIYDEDDVTNGTNYLWTLQVTEILGNYSHGRLTGRRFQCAPYNGVFPAEVQTLVDAYNAA
jgi:hypothetical protein